MAASHKAMQLTIRAEGLTCSSFRGLWESYLHCLRPREQKGMLSLLNRHC